MDKKKLLDFINTPKITPLQLVIAIVGIVLFIFLGTDTFADMSNGWKIVIYSAIVVVALLAKLNIPLGKLFLDIRAIWLDAKLSPLEKIKKIGNCVVKGCLLIGEAWEEVYDEQFGKSPSPQ